MSPHRLTPFHTCGAVPRQSRHTFSHPEAPDTPTLHFVTPVVVIRQPTLFYTCGIVTRQPRETMASATLRAGADPATSLAAAMAFAFASSACLSFASCDSRGKQNAHAAVEGVHMLWWKCGSVSA